AAVQRSSKLWHSTVSFDSDEGKDNEGEKVNEEEDFDDFLGKKKELQLQGVDPKRGWGFRGVHKLDWSCSHLSDIKAIICGKVGQAPLQKILRNGRTITIFTVGTGGLFDQRTLGSKDLPQPAQWHRIAVHDQRLGAYAVQKIVKNSSVYVEGDIETRVYNDSISGQVKNVPEICIRSYGRIRLLQRAENLSNISFEELREGLFEPADQSA
ncbi:Primosome PriB/single-strand DNA-binding, partial [Dillenia turbinata]